MNAAAPSTTLWTASDAAAAVAGTLSGMGAGDWTAAGVASDSRAVVAGDLFVALKGEQMDGHEFVAGALMRGAAPAMVSRGPAGLTRERLLLVADPRARLPASARPALAPSRPRR